MGALALAPAPLPPVPLAELKVYLRIATSEEDALLAGHVRCAAEACEAFTGRVLVERAVAETLPASTAWARLGAAPVRSIESVAALAAGGSERALAAADYAIDIDAAGEGWVRLIGQIEETRMRVGYAAGLAADPNGIPEPLRHGVLRLAAHLYGQRDSGRPAEPPAAVTALWRPWRRLRLG